MNTHLRILLLFDDPARSIRTKCLFLLTTALFLLALAPAATGQGTTDINDELSYPFLERLITIAQSNYPQGKVYDTRINIAEKGVKKSRLSYFEAISFSYLLSPFSGTAAVNPNMLNGYQFGLFFNIGSLLQKPALIEQARDALREAELEKGTYVLTLEADVKRRYFEYVKVKALYREISRSVLDFKSTIEDIKYKFERGEGTYESYNRALMDMSTRVQAKINMEGDVLIAKSNLEELVGIKLEDVR